MNGGRASETDPAQLCLKKLIQIAHCDYDQRSRLSSPGGR
jgi:hypothetical protein